MELSSGESNVSDDSVEGGSASTSALSTSTVSPQWLQNVVFFGEPCEFREDALPTRADVLHYAFFLYQNVTATKKHCSPLKLFAKLVAEKIHYLWNMTRIPVCKMKSIENKVSREIDRYQRTTKNTPSDFSEYVHGLQKLFDIACCKCESWVTCKCGQNQVPENARALLHDQRTARVLRLQPIADESEITENGYE